MQKRDHADHAGHKEEGHGQSNNATGSSTYVYRSRCVYLGHVWVELSD